MRQRGLETMEAASRPVFEPLTDLPVEAPIDGSVPIGATPSSSAASANAGSRKTKPEGPADELIAPESLLGGGDSDLLLDALNEAAASAPVASPPAGAVSSDAPFAQDSEELLGLDQLLLPEGPVETDSASSGGASAPTSSGDASQVST